MLWQDTKKVRLHGDSSQFPLSVVDFAEADLDPGAPWYVDLGNDLELPAMGAILLLLNERHPLVVAAAKDPSSERPELAVIRSVMFADVGRTLVEYALGQEDLERDWPDDSLGAVLKAVIKSYFGQSVAELRLLRDTDPVRWSATAASSLGLLREPLR